MVMMGKKKKKSVKSMKVNHDVLFIVQLFVGVVVFFSIYGHQLMGPFGGMIQSIGFSLFSDALPLLPWLLFLTSVSLVVAKPVSVRRYYINLGVFLVFFLTLIDSLFLNKMVTHGQVSWALTDLIIWGGGKLFGSFGVRFLCFAVSVTFGVLLFHVSI